MSLVRDDASVSGRGRLVARLPLRLKSRSEPYELIARRNAHRHPALTLLIDSLLALRPVAEEAPARIGLLNGA